MGHSEGNWKVGRCGSVVTDRADGFNEASGHCDTEYYGGFLICESIHKKEDSMLIAASPDMLTALKIAVGLIDRDPISFTKEEKLKHCLDAINKAEGTSLEIAPGIQINNFLKSVK